MSYHFRSVFLKFHDIHRSSESEHHKDGHFFVGPIYYLILNASYLSLPMHKMTNTDLSRILKSEEIQKALRVPK